MLSHPLIVLMKCLMDKATCWGYRIRTEGGQVIWGVVSWGLSAPHLKSHEDLLYLQREWKRGNAEGGSEEKRGAYLSIAYSAENPLMLFIRVMSFKGRGKGKPLKRGGWKAASCGRTGKGEKKGLLGAPGDPKVRQRRYPCLRQEFHSIGSVKTRASGGEQGV